MIDPALIPLLRCPATEQPLRLATDAEKLRHGVPADEYALISEDGSHLYRSELGMPVLLSAKEVVATG